MATPDETADRVAIDALQRAYADGLDRRDWSAVRACFLPDATVELDLVDRPGLRLDGPDAITGFIGPAIERFALFQFVILNSHVELWPDGDLDAATARVFIMEVRAGSGGQRDDAIGLYRDRYRRLDGRWRIAGRHYRSMARFPVGTVHPLPPAAPEGSPEP